MITYCKTLPVTSAIQWSSHLWHNIRTTCAMTFVSGIHVSLWIDDLVADHLTLFPPAVEKQTLCLTEQRSWFKPSLGPFCLELHVLSRYSRLTGDPKNCCCLSLCSTSAVDWQPLQGVQGVRPSHCSGLDKWKKRDGLLLITTYQ